MSERAKVTTEQALALSASEREELCLVLAASLGKPDAPTIKHGSMRPRTGLRLATG